MAEDKDNPPLVGTGAESFWHRRTNTYPGCTCPPWRYNPRYPKPTNPYCPRHGDEQMTLLVELRTLRFEQTKVAYEIGELNQKIKLDPKRADMKSIRAKKIARVKELNDQHAALLPRIEASPYSRIDLADVINKLADIESQMVHGGIEQAHGAIRSYIDWLTADAARLDRMADATDGA